MRLPFYTTHDMKLVGAVGVDSGQLMIVDPCYITDGPVYEDICNVTLEKPGYGEVDGGFATSTLYGDGLYPVYAITDVRGRIRGMLVWMDDEEPEDEDDVPDDVPDDGWYD